ncbi:SGNH/GDSL hydrolase family protein [Maribellus maritimus]|uniref:SGNH/GDSL hydrolase family protein n=1 Tax=Maribellus maritimus TaxID=2870838 RepID=UPI001EEC88D1|nr:SGNH/GDSL hydrolase family protein [Maribellus maritimus]MCG6188601.1 SGNH/GDSL hydrolase family protein [Maribellus maritimus]
MKTNTLFRKFLYTILLVVAVSFVASALENSGILTSKELNARGGLPNYFSKIQKGKSIRVAYLGGSITAQAGWRVYSLEWMKEKFPLAKFEEIHAAIGGTGSNFGVFRLHEHVLRFKPDLLFVEFAVNDDGAASERVIRAMEGIVRQTWEDNPYVDICFVYTIKGDFLETETNGQLPKSAQAMEKVADKYGIPSVNFGFEVAQQVKEGKLIFSNPDSKEVNGVPVFCPDRVHPYVETGHKIYKTVLARSFDTIKKEKTAKAKKHKVSKPVNPEYFSDTRMLDFTNAELSDNWEIIPVEDDERFNGFGRFLDHVGRTCYTGETIAVHFKGTAIGVYDIMGPDAGKVAVEIDGEPRDTLSRFDKYCTYRRMNFVIIDKLENKEHQVVFKVIAEPFDKRSILTKKEDFDQHPEKYSENCWHVGKILLDGELLK